MREREREKEEGNRVKKVQRKSELCKKNIKENIKIKKFIKSGGGEVPKEGERIE